MKRAFTTAFLCLLLATPAWADFDEEKAAYYWDDYVTAVRQLRPVAEQGDAKAQFRLGLLYDHGKGVPADEAEALKWYRMAAEQGLAVAQNKLGFLYAEGKGVRRDYVEALKWYKRSAEQGDITGKTHIIRMRFKALIQKAELHWARSAFDKGKSAYERGDYTAVLREWRPLAEQGHARAQNSLGLMHEYGHGVPKDKIEARKWFVLAAKGGNENASGNLDKVDKELTPAEIAEAQKLAREWWAAFKKRKN